MQKEIKINGYRCKFIDNTESPDCEFLCIPIVHDVKYVKSWATISFTPEEKETFGKRIHILDSRMMPSTVPSKDAKQLTDLVRKGFYQKLPLNHISADNKRFLLSKLRDNNVKFTLQ